MDIPASRPRAVHGAPPTAPLLPPHASRLRITHYGLLLTTSSLLAPLPAAAQAPTLAGVTPDFGFSTGGNSVALAGTDLTGATAVTFGGNPAPSFVVDSAVQITATVPPGTSTAADVAVTTPGGTATLAGAYTYMRPGSWGATPPAPGNVAAGGNAAKAGGFIYAFQGGTNAFWRFDPSIGLWTPLAPVPAATADGAALAYPGAGDFIYASMGGSAVFARYAISTDAWSDPAVANLPAGAFGAGAALLAPGNGFVYALLGGGTPTFTRYDIAGNAWNDAAVANFGFNCGAACSISYDGANFIYAHQGNNAARLRRYSIAGNAWVARANTPANRNLTGNALAYVTVSGSDYIYALRGSNTAVAWRYSVAGNSWDDASFAEAPATCRNGTWLVAANNATLFAARGNNAATFWQYDTAPNEWLRSKVSTSPGNVDAGAALASEGVGYGVFYAFQGGTAAFWKYDAATGAWTALASPVGARGDGATLVYSGGGFVYAFRGGATAQFERYNMSTDAWDDAGVPDAPAVVGAGGSLVWTGGSYLYATEGGGATGFWRYTLPDGPWDDAAAADVPNNFNAGGDLAYPGSGDFLYAMTGGGSNRFLRYQVSTNAWSDPAVANLPNAAGAGGGLAAPGGDYIYALRGNNQTNFWRYSISGNAWTVLAAAPETVGAGGALASLSNPSLRWFRTNDYLLAFRGLTTPTVWMYGIHGTGARTGGAWSAANPMNIPRAGQSATAIGATEVLVAGGHTGIFSLREAERYDTTTGNWTPAAPMASARYLHTATPLADGTVLVAGGYDENWNALDTAERYDPAAGTWSPAATMTGGSGRVGHTATLLSDGRVLVGGGEDGNGTPLDTTTLFTAPASWAAGPVLATPRAYHAAGDRLSDNDVLFVGGWNWGGVLASCDRWDQATGTIAATGAMAIPRMSHVAVTVNGGADVLVCGGWDGSAAATTASAEQYSAAAAIWSSAGAMSTPRADHRAVSTGAAVVLVVGGWRDPGSGNILLGIEGLDSAETWTFGAPGVWASAGAIGMKKWEHAVSQAGTGATFVQEGGWFLGAAAAKATWERPSGRDPMPVGTTFRSRPHGVVGGGFAAGRPLPPTPFVPTALRKTLPPGTPVRMAGEVIDITGAASAYSSGGALLPPAAGFSPASGGAVSTPYPALRWDPPSPPIGFGGANPPPGAEADAARGLAYEVRIDSDAWRGDPPLGAEALRAKAAGSPGIPGGTGVPPLPAAGGTTAPGVTRFQVGPVPLDTGRAYAWAVRVQDPSGEFSTWSEVQTFHVASASLPPPSALKVHRRRRGTEAKVDWRGDTPVSPGLSRPSAHRLRLWDGGGLALGPTDASPDVKKARIRGLDPAEDYTITVSSVDKGGVESAPAVAEAPARAFLEERDPRPARKDGNPEDLADPSSGVRWRGGTPVPPGEERLDYAAAVIDPDGEMAPSGIEAGDASLEVAFESDAAPDGGSELPLAMAGETGLPVPSEAEGSPATAEAPGGAKVEAPSYTGGACFAASGESASSPLFSLAALAAMAGWALSTAIRGKVARSAVARAISRPVGAALGAARRQGDPSRVGLSSAGLPAFAASRLRRGPPQRQRREGGCPAETTGGD